MFPIDKFDNLQTPFYYYDTDLLRATLQAINNEVARHENYVIHYAVKANANPKVLQIIREAGLSVDCVSGGEIERVIESGFQTDQIVFAGVGKNDWEIRLALDKNIFCFNVESAPELAIINELAAEKGQMARICLRINPDIDAHTHAHITTGSAENKFGIAMKDVQSVLEMVEQTAHIQLIGLHFHIGSQIVQMQDFASLCARINMIQDELERRGIQIEVINVGGGLGVDYQTPDKQPIPDFRSYFNTYAENLQLRPHQQLHFELGRAVVAQCGSLITRVLYVKQGSTTQFVIVDAGMTDLIRPALYQASHKIENLTSSEPQAIYDVVGPICESSDIFAKTISLPRCHRGDLLAIRSAGAYGEIMANQYNCRSLPASFTKEEIDQ